MCMEVGFSQPPTNWLGYLGYLGYCVGGGDKMHENFPSVGRGKFCEGVRKEQL